MKAFLRLVLLFTLLPMMSFSFAADELYKAGVNYEVLANPSPTENSDKVQVDEFFWYGCPHCYVLEPHLVAWLSKKPANVEFKRIPAALNPSWAIHAKFYYAMESMGIVDQHHEAVFDVIQKEHTPLMSEPEILDFMQKRGVDRAKFQEAMNSFEVDGLIRRSNQLAGQYRLNGVPNVIVANKYRVDAAMAGGAENLFKVVDFLIAKESKKN